MPKPLIGVPDLSGPKKIMFMNEDNPTAMLLTNRGGKRRIDAKPMTTAEAALAWCRKNGAMLVYTPVNLERN